MAGRLHLQTGGGEPIMDKPTGSSSLLDWTTEDEYWRSNYASRPYAGSRRDYGYWQPAYRYGYESAQRYRGRNWDDVENDLRTAWDTYPHRGGARSTWEDIKAAVRDGWDRLVGNR
jgi:hypothetical protein